MEPSPSSSSCGDQRKWVQNSLRREADRGDEFSSIERILQASPSFEPTWRRVIVQWFRQVGAAYSMCPVTLENAIRFLDVFIASNLSRGVVLDSLRFQSGAMVALLLASKFYGVIGTSHITIPELIRLAPQLQVTATELCHIELKLIASLHFNLFVSTSFEFIEAFLGIACSELPRNQFEDVKAKAYEYLATFEGDLKFIQFLQSQKALTCVRFALAFFHLKEQQTVVATTEAAFSYLQLSNPDVTFTHTPFSSSLDTLSEYGQQITTSRCESSLLQNLLDIEHQARVTAQTTEAAIQISVPRSRKHVQSPVDVADIACLDEESPVDLDQSAVKRRRVV